MAAMDTVNISIGCMKPGSMRQKEPRQAAVDQEFRKRMRLDSKALAENTLMLATRDPIMLLRVRQKEHQHKPAVGDGQFWDFDDAQISQLRMKARKIFHEKMPESTNSSGFVGPRVLVDVDEDNIDSLSRGRPMISGFPETCYPTFENMLPDTLTHVARHEADIELRTMANTCGSFLKLQSDSNILFDSLPIDRPTAHQIC